jgi:hypothetical protein
VSDTYPRRTVICECPTDYVQNARGECAKITYLPPPPSGCTRDSECKLTERCLNRKCVDACLNEQCGINAQCKALNHAAVCICPPGYEGDPRVHCSVPPPPLTGCSSNSECANYEVCENRACISPCNAKPCAANAICHAENHRYVCRCPSGFTGDARFQCVYIPRKFYILVIFPL